VHLHHQAGLRIHGLVEVAQVAAVGGADLDQLRAGAAHDVGHAEGAADLDQLAARDDDLLPLRQGVEQQEHRRGVVVHHGGGLRPGQFAQQAVDDVVAVAASARLQVVFESAGRARGAGDGCDDGLGQHGAAEVGVQHRAGEVEHRLQARPHVRGDATGDGRDDRVVRGQRGAGLHRLAHESQFGAHGVGDDRAAVLGDEGVQGRLGQETVDGRKVLEFVHAFTRTGQKVENGDIIGRRSTFG
jgi:hypothetical protein